MILVVDIGNTRIKWAWVSERGMLDPGEAVHERIPGASLKSLAEAAPGRPERVVAVNVAGETLASYFTEDVTRRWEVVPEFVNTAHEAHGVRCAYADPSRLGSDRWVALIAGYRLAAGAACVIDAGTAVTLDAVDARGYHLGGLILAGPRVIATALDRQTSGIGETRGQPRPGPGVAVLGTGTDEAVAKGAMLGLAGALDRALSGVADELGERPAVYLTGGDAESLSPWLDTSCEFRPHLVLEGLGSIAGVLDLPRAKRAQHSG